MKEAKKGSWFRKKNNKFSSVFFVPPTPNSVLMKMLQKTEDTYKIGETDKSSKVLMYQIQGATIVIIVLYVKIRFLGQIAKQ